RMYSKEVAPDRRTLRTVLRDTFSARTILDRLAPDKVLTPDPADRLHNQHPPPPARVPKRVSLHITAQRGSKLDADHPSTGVNLPRRNTPSYRGRRPWLESLRHSKPPASSF